MKCKYCDSVVPDYYNNCPHCGAQLIKDGFSEQHSEQLVKKKPTVHKSKTPSDNDNGKENITDNDLKFFGMMLIFIIIMIVCMLFLVMLAQ